MARGEGLPAWAARTFQSGHRDKPIIVVPGNHEFYGAVFQEQRRLMKEAELPHVHVLDPGEVLLDEGRIRVIGCTLWTDFKLPVVTPTGAVSDQQRAMDNASRFMSDYRVIEFQEEGRPRRRLAPADTLSRHWTEREWLLDKLREPFNGETIVVTHHAPSRESVATKWADDWLTPSFVSDLPFPFFEVPVLWVHGHTHVSRDYRRGRTRVISNPRAAPRACPNGSCASRAPGLVIDTSTIQQADTQAG